MSRLAWALALASGLVLILWLASRSRPQAATGVESVPEEHFDDAAAAIARANRECAAALERGDARAYAAHYAEDGISLPGKAPAVRGRAAIEGKILETFQSAEISEAQWRTLETRVAGKTAFETGVYRFCARPYGSRKTEVQAGRYFIVWKRVGSEWKIAIDAVQPGAPAA